MDINVSFGSSERFGSVGKTLARTAHIRVVDPIVPIGFVIPYSAAQDVIHTMDK